MTIVAETATHPQQTAPVAQADSADAGELRLLRLASRLLSAPVAALVQRNADGDCDFCLLPEQLEAQRPEVLSMARALCAGLTSVRKLRPAAGLRELGFSAAVAAPLASLPDDMLGALVVLDVRQRGWSELEMRTLEQIAAASGDMLSLRHTLAETRALAVRLQRNGLYDPLTGLPNRVLFMDRTTHALARAKRRGESAAVLFLDLDHFKLVNDSLGHQVGDDLLVAIARRLQACLRVEDTVARLGGDEFAVLLEGVTNLAGATRVAERIRDAMRAPINLSGYEVFTGASIGIALNTSFDRPEYLLRNADMAMYRAKESGRGGFEVFDRTMHAEALARLQLETDLRRAIEEGEFRLNYQPIVSLGSGRIVGCEALLRWQHPQQGPISPADFIPVAEETGLILPIGRWVLSDAIRQLQKWQQQFAARGGFSMCINLSSKQFYQCDLPEQVEGLLRETGADGRGLTLEITEGVVVDNSPSALALLGRLKSLGAQVYLDDFGTGYSSLGYLHRLPLDALKIDRSFVGRMDTETKHRQLVQTILMLAQGVGIGTVAEGIETSGQLDALRSMGCDFGQGYLFSRPLEPDAFEALLHEDPQW